MEHFREVKFDGIVHTFNCPHCDGAVQVDSKEVNCAIFRHGQYNDNPKNGNLKWQQMNPHESEAQTIYLADNKLIVGCGKPIMMCPDKTKVKTCNYI